MKILFMGDANFSRRERPLTKADAEYMLSDVKPYLEDADFRVVNMEEPLGDINKYEPISKSGPNLISSAENIFDISALSVSTSFFIDVQNFKYLLLIEDKLL